jgi:hypothetical protein
MAARPIKGATNIVQGLVAPLRRRTIDLVVSGESASMCASAATARINRCRDARLPFLGIDSYRVIASATNAPLAFCRRRFPPRPLVRISSPRFASRPAVLSNSASVSSTKSRDAKVWASNVSSRICSEGAKLTVRSAHPIGASRARRCLSDFLMSRRRSTIWLSLKAPFIAVLSRRFSTIPRISTAKSRRAAGARATSRELAASQNFGCAAHSSIFISPSACGASRTTVVTCPATGSRRPAPRKT